MAAADAQLPAGVVLRRAEPADVPALAALYAAAAAACGPAVYAPDQVAAWVAFGADTPAFRDYVFGPETWVALDGAAGGVPVGFSGLLADAAAPDGEIRSLYVAPAWHRRGLGRALIGHGLARAAARGLQRVEAWVTPVSRPVFERAGFRLLRTEQQLWGGVSFERYRVGRELAAG